MPILMKYEGIDGESTLNGKEGFLILEGLSWSVTRSMAAVKAGSRGDADCRVEEVEVSRRLDSSSAALLKQALVGTFDRKVEIHLVRTGGQNRMLTFGQYELQNCGISAYVAETAGDIPTERLRLNFTKVLFKSFKVEDDLSAVPDTAFYDLLAGTGG